MAARLLAEDGDGRPGEVDDVPEIGTSSRPNASVVASTAAAACARSVTSSRTALAPPARMSSPQPESQTSRAGRLDDPKLREPRTLFG